MLPSAALSNSKYDYHDYCDYDDCDDVYDVYDGDDGFEIFYLCKVVGLKSGQQ